MTRIWSEGEAIRVETRTESDGADYPVRFRWRGRWHRIERIVQRWQVDSDWWSSEGRVWRDYLAAITADGVLLVLYYDHPQSEWRLAKVYD
jgi:hypothetical protein